MSNRGKENHANGRCSNPWLAIPLDDYEGHMTLPTVRQANLLSNTLHDALNQYQSKSVCVLGCSGGNGFDRIPRDCRVCGIDVNPAYVASAESRFGNSFSDILFLTCDIETGIPSYVGQFDMVYAALLFEYLDARRALSNVLPLAIDCGVIVVVAQLPTKEMDEITPTPFTSLYALDGFMRLIDVDELASLFAIHGFLETFRSEVASEPGKRFCILHFTRTPAQTEQEHF